MGCQFMIELPEADPELTGRRLCALLRALPAINEELSPDDCVGVALPPGVTIDISSSWSGVSAIPEAEQGADEPANGAKAQQIQNDPLERRTPNRAGHLHRSVAGGRLLSGKKARLSRPACHFRQTPKDRTQRGGNYAGVLNAGHIYTQRGCEDERGHGDHCLMPRQLIEVLDHLFWTLRTAIAEANQRLIVPQAAERAA